MEQNPVPWLTDRWGSYDALTDRRAGASGTGLTAAQIGSTLDVLSTVVGSLADDDRPYRVRFGNGVSTFTDLDGKAVTIGAAPLYDETLNAAQRAAVLTGLAFHEVAHVRHTRRLSEAKRKAWDNHPQRDRAYALSNIAEDVYAEGQTAREFPGLRATLPVTLDWMASRTIPRGTKASRTQGINLAVGAVRYAEHLDWTGMEDHLAWWQDWGARAVDARTPSQHVALVEEGLARLAEPVEPVEDEPSEGGDQPGEDESEDGEGQPGGDTDGEPDDEQEPQPGQGQGESESEDESGEGNGDGESEDESDEDGSEGGTGSSDESEPDGESEGEGEGDPTDGGNGEATDADGDTTDDVEDGDGFGHEYAEHAEDEVQRGEDESEPEQGKGGVDAVTNAGGGGDPTDGADVFLPVCPREASQTGRETAVMDKVDALRRAKRENTGLRRYPLAGWSGGGQFPVQRIKMTNRGRAIRTAEANPQSFLAPTIGADLPVEHRVAPVLHAGIGTNQISKPSIRPDVSRALAGAITRQRTGDRQPETGHRSGSLDRNRLARVGSGDFRVFQSPAKPGPTRLRVLVLLDASSSMYAEIKDKGRGLGISRASATAQIGVDLAGALDMLPYVEAAVYAHGSGSIPGQNSYGSFIFPLWQKGEPIEYAGDYAGLRLSGNYDAMALRYGADDLLETRKPNERLLIVIVSDGSPSDPDEVARAVKDIRNDGVEVVSVSVAPDLGIEGQRTMYGDHVIEFFPSPMALAKSIAKAMGRALR